jgi:hypothetical protein
MLITRYGLRSADLQTMKLSDLRWSENVIDGPGEARAGGQNAGMLLEEILRMRDS